MRRRRRGLGTRITRAGLSSTLGAQKTPAAPNAARVTIADGGNKNVMWMSRDRRTLYGSHGNVLVSSVDDGATWANLNSFPVVLNGVRELDNGELLVSTVAASGTPGSLYLSSGFKAKPTGATWTKVLDAGAGGVGPSSAFHGGWGMSTHGAIAVVSEYGLQNPPTDSARFVYLSEDSGATWTQIFDVGTAASAHVHGCAYDPWWDAIWVVNGDNAGNRATRVSFDRGSTWTVVDTGNQPVCILPMETCILFGTDSTPNGVLRIDRSKGKSGMTLDVAYRVSEAATLTHVAAMPFQSGAPHAPAVFPFLAQSGPGVIATTYDGWAFSTTWTDTASYTVKGPLRVVGPTSSGLLVGALSDDRQANYSRLTLPAPPSRERAGQDADVDLAMRLALQTSVGLMPSGAYYSWSGCYQVSSAAITDGRIYLAPVIIPRDIIIDHMGLEIVVAGSAGEVVRLGVFRRKTDATFEVVADAGTVPADGATGYKSVTPSIPLAPGLYWLGAAAQGGGTGPNVRRGNGGLNNIIGNPFSASEPGASLYAGYGVDSVSGAFSGTYTTSGAQTSIPRIVFRVK